MSKPLAPLLKFLGLLIPYALMFLLAHLVFGIAFLVEMLAGVLDGADKFMGQYMARLWREAKD